MIWIGAKNWFCIAGAALLCALLAPAAAADFWVGPSAQGVVTSNDCGFVSRVEGQPVVRRYFMNSDEQGLTIFGADRINAGDNIEVPDNAGLEIVCGNNLVFCFSGGSKVRFLGLRSFMGPDGRPLERLDVILEQGTIRAQARRNERREMLLVQTSGVTVLLENGDLLVNAGAGWRATNFGGLALARLRRGDVVGAPFELERGVAFANTGRKALSDAEMDELRYSLPLSFEITRAALPPRPAMDDSVEAP